jgi:hypothetical protein
MSKLNTRRDRLLNDRGGQPPRQPLTRMNDQLSSPLHCQLQGIHHHSAPV